LFFEKINKINKPLTNTRWKREMIQINKIKDGKGDITSNTNDIQRIIGEYFENLCLSKLEILEEMNKFLDKYNQPKLNQEDINHLNRFITTNEIKALQESSYKDEFKT
jgi:hypothetical protein